MIRHVVLFRFRDGIGWSDPRAPRAEAATRGHPEHIAEILRWDCGRGLTAGPGEDRHSAYDFALTGEFADSAALRRYLVHPDHLRGVELWREIADWRLVDYEITPPAGSTRAPAPGDTEGPT